MPDEETQNSAAAGDDESHIEMPPDYVGQAEPPGSEAAHDANAAAFRILSPAEAAAAEAAEAAAAEAAAAERAVEAAFRAYDEAGDAEKAALQAAAKAAADAANSPTDDATERAVEAAQAAKLAHAATAAALERWEDAGAAAVKATAAAEAAADAADAAVIDAADATDAAAAGAEAAAAKAAVIDAREALSDAYDAEKAARAAADEAAADYADPERAAEAYRAAEAAHAATTAALNEYYAAETAAAEAAAAYADAAAADAAAADVALRAADEALVDADGEAFAARQAAAKAAADAANSPTDDAIERAVEAAAAARAAHAAHSAALSRYHAAEAAALEAGAAAEAAAAETPLSREGETQDETQAPDAEGVEIEMPPDYVGRINIGYPRPVSEDEAREKESPEDPEIEMPPDYVGQTGADAAGDNEIDIDLLERLEKYNKELEGAGFSKLQREELLRKYSEYDKELADKSYEELSSIYKEVMKDANDYSVAYKDDPNWIDRQNLRDFEGTNTLQELQTGLRELMRERDFGHVFEQNLKYDKELADLDINTYEELADFYTDYIGVLYDDNFPTGADFERWKEQTDLKSYKHLDTYEELKAAFRDLMTTRDKWLEENERKRIEEEIEMLPPDSDEQAGGGEAADAPAADPWRGAPHPGTVEQEEAPPLVDEPGPDEPSATERVEPLGSEAAPIEGEASSRLIGGGGVPPTDDLRDKAFAGYEEEGAPEAAATAAPAEAGDANKIETPPDSVGNPIIGSFKDIDTQDVLQGGAPLQNEAQEYQRIDTQEQSTFEAVPEQSMSGTEAQRSVDQDELLNPYEDDPSPIPKDELLNPYEDEEGPIPKDQLLNPYEDEPSSIPED